MAVRLITDLPSRNSAPIPWVDVQSNFPWDDPEFSKQMLRKHLDTSHDEASRRPEIMAAQVEWMDSTWFRPRKAKSILDLACGPGLIANSLARKDYTVKGIDIAPASINYGRKIAADWGLPASFIQGDIRQIGYGSGFDAALFNYGLANSFKREDFALILHRIKEALNPGGIVILEMITPEAMAKKVGKTWHTRLAGGLFGRRAYLALKEYFFYPSDITACEIHYVIDLETTRVNEYSICCKGYRDEELAVVLKESGLKKIAEFDSLTGETGIKDSEMRVIVAERPAG